MQARFEVENLVNAIAIDPAGRIAVATSGSILTVRSPDGELLHQLDGHLSSASAVAWTSDGHYSREATTARSSAGTWAMINHC